MVDPIKCAFILEENPQPGKTVLPKVEFEHQDGSPLSKNELVDIGGTRWGHKWPSTVTNFTWKFTNKTDDITAYWLRRATTAAFRTVGFLIPRRFTYERNPNATAHFNIEFTEDLSVFDNRRMVLAQAYLFHPNNPPGFNGLIQWNDNWFFTPFGDELPAHLVDNVNYTEGEKWADGRLKMLGTQPFVHIEMHEHKHSMGYRHDTNSPESIMYPYAKAGYNADGTVNSEAFIWTPDDILRWEEGYGRRGGISGWIGRMRARRLRGRFVDGIPYRVMV